MPSLGKVRTKLVLGRETKFEWSDFYLVLVRFWSVLVPKTLPETVLFVPEHTKKGSIRQVGRIMRLCE